MVGAMCVMYLILGLIPAGIAKVKGYSFAQWYIYGILLFVFALPHALFIRRIVGKDLKNCPLCKSVIDVNATVCPCCTRDI